MYGEKNGWPLNMMNVIAKDHVGPLKWYGTPRNTPSTIQRNYIGKYPWGFNTHRSDSEEYRPGGSGVRIWNYKLV